MIVLLLALISIITRFITSNGIPIDSDEITWSIIGRRVFAGEDFHIFFLGQKYMGAIEGYIVGLFQLIFGYNYITLRINSFIFTTLLALAIYYILKNEHSKTAGFLSAILFLFLMSYDNALNYTKAWGNVPFVSLIGFLSIYLSYLTYIKERKVVLFSAVNGLLLGIGFWANLQTYFFVAINFIIFALSMLPSNLFKIRFKLNARFLITSVFYTLTFILFFMITFKKGLINPYLTITTKLNINSPYLNFLNYNFEPGEILKALYPIGLIKIVFFPSLNKKLKALEITIFAFLIGAYFNITRISVGRAAGEITTYKETAQFFFKAILPKFLGYNLNNKSKIFQILIIEALTLFPAYTIFRIIAKNIKKQRPNIAFIDILPLYFLIPIFFILSKPAGVNASSRFISSLWPGYIILFALGFYLLLTSKNILLKIISILTFLFFLFNFPLNIFNLKHETTNYPLQVANFLIKKDIKTCYAGYWNAYPIMFESKYKIICSPSKYYGYGENETPFNTKTVDKDNNPAFIFTTQKRVNEFKTKWVEKEIKILEKKKIGKYFVFLTERI